VGGREDLPDLLPDALTGFELFKVPLKKKVRVVKVALEEVRVVGKVPLSEVSLLGLLSLLFLAEVAAVFFKGGTVSMRSSDERRGGAYKKRFWISRSMSSSKSLSNNSASMSSSLVVSSEEEGAAGFGPNWVEYCLLQNKYGASNEKKNEHGILEPQARCPLQELEVAFRELSLEKVSGV